MSVNLIMNHRQVGDEKMRKMRNKTATAPMQPLQLGIQLSYTYGPMDHLLIDLHIGFHYNHVVKITVETFPVTFRSRSERNEADILAHSTVSQAFTKVVLQPTSYQHQLAFDTSAALADRDYSFERTHPGLATATVRSLSGAMLSLRL